MTFRQTDGPAVSAAKASISTATAYRFEQDHRPPSAKAEPRGRRRSDPLVAFFDAECKTACKTFQIPGVNSVQKFPPRHV